MNGSRAELLHLRQMSKDYHKLINPIYLQHVGKILRIITYTRSNSQPEYIEILRNNSVDEQNGFRVTKENWTSEIAHIFQRLKLDSIWYILSRPNFKLNELDPKLIIHQVSPYITTLDLEVLPIHEDLKNLNLFADFMKQFSNLNMLNINYYQIGNEPILVDTILTALNPNVLIKLLICENEHRNDYESLLAKYGATKQMKTNLILLVEVERFEELRILADNHANLTNLKFVMDLMEIIKSLEELETYTSLCVLDTTLSFTEANFIEEVKIELVITGRGCSTKFQPQDEEAVKRCLVQLSPIVTKLSISSGFNWDFLAPSADMNWNKLSILKIFRYRHPLEILKITNRLRRLSLIVDWNICIFHDKSKSRKESIKEYFSNLSVLEKFDFCSDRRTELELAEEAELNGLLAEVLPKNTDVEIWT